MDYLKPVFLIYSTVFSSLLNFTNPFKYISFETQKKKENEFLIIFDETPQPEEIDYTFDTNNYLVNVSIDNIPMLFVFTVFSSQEHLVKTLLTNKISKETSYETSNIIFFFNNETMKVKVLADPENIVSIKITEL
jgi:hypothetical protein